METSLRTDFAQIFSRCPKNLSCPKFGGAAAPLALPARTPQWHDFSIWETGICFKPYNKSHLRPDYIYENHCPLITQWNRNILNLRALQSYADSISRKGALLNNCFGFVDGTVMRTRIRLSFAHHMTPALLRMLSFEWQAINFLLRKAISF